MTKQLLIRRIEGAIDQTKGDIRRAAKLAREWKAKKANAFMTIEPTAATRYAVATQLEQVYVTERNALISQLRMLRGIVR